ncbi:MAG: acyl-ACP--UDP-N-acetylglucosamine O-acyltransferase [Deltaproteobacteria bacterium]|nr:acyl-ACP--UDP-N-acetylglucosamine O-acyltransferase [Deltaproteobacteria bacterium]
MKVHPTAVISAHAQLDPDVEIGPYCVIGEEVSIGKGTIIGSHAVIEGPTSIGEQNTIFPFVCIGTPPQDVGYKDEDTSIRIGNGNIIREYVNINRATTKQDGITIVGNNNYIMAYSHVAHDCVLGDGIIMANVATLGGHTIIGDHANLGGIVATHQFVRIGAYAFIGGKSAVSQDVPPFVLAVGDRAKPYGINQKGLKRFGFSREVIDGLKKAYRIIWRETRQLNEGISRVRKEIPLFPELEMFLEFIMDSKRGVIR